MQYSGILIRLQPDAWDEGLARLGAVPDIEIHHREAETGRVIVVVESEGLAGQEGALKAIRDLPGVILAEPVYHYAPEPATPESGTPESGTPESGGPTSGTPDADPDREEDPS